MEEIRDVHGKLVAVVEPSTGIARYAASGKISITVQTCPGTKIEIETTDSRTIIERVNNWAFNVLQYVINR